MSTDLLQSIEALSRYRWDQDLDVLIGPRPDGEWVRHADVVAVIADQEKRTAPRDVCYRLGHQWPQHSFAPLGGGRAICQHCGIEREIPIPGQGGS